MLRAYLFRPAVLGLALGAACTSPNGASDSGTGGEEEVEPDFAPGPGGARKLLGRQYNASVAFMLGAQAAEAADPPRDFPLHDFDSIGAAQLSLSATDIEQYELSATAVADATVLDMGVLGATAPCALEASPSDACYTEIASRLGHLAWRRPLTDAELTRLAEIGVAGRMWGDDAFSSGVKYELMAILQSPHFLYISEVGEAVEPEDGAPAYRRLTAPEHLTRMSFFLTGRTPSLGDLEIVEAGGLNDAQTEELAWAMLSQPSARTTVGDFFDELYRLRETSGVAKDLELFPNYSAELGESMRAESLRLIETIIWEENTDALAILDAPYGFVDNELAAVYGVAPPGGTGLTRVDYPAEQGRGGLLGQAAFLTRHAHPAKSSPTRRGLFVQTKILCTDVPPPPPGVDTSIPEDDGEPKTLREKLQIHMENGACRSCHVRMDPIGFGLESYGPIGNYRTHEQNGLPIDANTEVGGLGSYSTAAELGSLLKEHPLTSNCLVRNVMRNGLGRIESDAEEASIEFLDEGFIANERNLQELLVQIVRSKLFTRVGEPK